MDFKFNKDTESKQPAPAEKGRQNSLVLLLLLLVGGFCYLYFFTSLIRPQQEQKPVQAVTPQVIKNPLPSPVQSTALPPASEGVTPQTTPEQGKPKPVPTAAPAVQEVKKSGDASKTAVSGPTERTATPAPVAAAKKEQKPSATNASGSDAKKAPVTTSSESASATSAAKAKSSAEKKAPKEKEILATATAGKTKTKPIPAKPAHKHKPDTPVGVGPWTVVVGTYVLEDAMATDMVRVRKEGFDASVQAGPRKKTSMSRLYVTEFPERDAAQAELNKLKRHTSDAFILDQGGSFAVFAGSYLLDGRAVSEKERLVAAGFPVTLKKVDVAIPTKKLTAGKFTDKSAAEAALKKLKEAGFKPALAR